MLGQSGCCVLRSALTCFPASSHGHALALKRQRSRADFRDQVSFRRHQRTIAGSAVVGQHMCGVERRTLSSTASQLAGVPPSPKMFGMVLFCTTSPEISVRSGSTKVSSSPLVWAPPNQSRRAVTPPKVDRRFLVESHVGRAQHNARQQLLILRRTLR